MRSEPSVLHLDLDAFFAAVEQRDKPSLRGKPVIVGGLGPRGVVSTASYEARRFGVRSAMRMAEARARCPHAAFLSGRFPAYRQASRDILVVLRTLSPLVEPLSLDEAFVDLAAGEHAELTVSAVERISRELKARIRAVTGGLTASVGAGTSKLIAKIASDLDKPDGLVVVAAGTERALLAHMSVSRIPGVGPATHERLRRIGVATIGQLANRDVSELVSTLGSAHGTALWSLARAEDERQIVSERESKSVSVEDTFDRDIADPSVLGVIIDRLATTVIERLTKERLSGRTVTVKIRLFDFSTHTRSATLAGPTDDIRVVKRLARRLLTEVDTTAGARLLGVGVSGLADWVQGDLFTDLEAAAERDAAVPTDNADTADPELADPELAGTKPAGTKPAGTKPAGTKPAGTKPAGTGAEHVPDGANTEPARAGAEIEPAHWAPGADVAHAELGRGWVWGSGLGRVTVRFETATTPPGPVRTFRADDPALSRWSLPEPE